MKAVDIGANRGDWTLAALKQGYEVIAIEPGKIFGELVSNFIYNPNVTPLKFAVSGSDYERIEFYECVEDGLSTINIDWLTADGMPYKGKDYYVSSATTITLDTLNELYGPFDLIKLDVEGAEWQVFKGFSSKMGTIAFEWTLATLEEHIEQLKYLEHGGYTEIGPQYIEHHCQEPDTYYKLSTFDLGLWHEGAKAEWERENWKISGLRPTADVGMCWVR